MHKRAYVQDLRRSIVCLLLAGALMLAWMLGPLVVQAQVPEHVIATTGAPHARQVSTADFDGDGDEDVIPAANKLAWYENRVGESGADAHGFGPPQYIDSTSGARSVYAADIDGDGDPDLFTTEGTGIGWYENQIGETGADAGGFGPRQGIATTGDDAATAVHATDLDGDGDHDVIFAARNQGDVLWAENQVGENGSDSDGFGSGQVISTVDGTEAVHAADVDGDGDPEVLSASSPSDEDSKIAWYENQIGESGADSDGFGSQQVIVTYSAEVTSVYTSDLDGDSDPEVLSTSSRVSWYENQMGEDGADSDGFGPRETVTTNVSGPSSVFATDLNGDDESDVLSASRLSDRIAWYENRIGDNGVDSVRFGAQQVLTTKARQARSVRAVDLNGDGHPEVLSASSTDNKVAWYENQIGEDGGDADGFGPQQFIAADGQEPQSVRAVDLDGDGDADVLSALGHTKIAWYENTGTDRDGFRPQRVIATSEGPRSVVAADIDGDEDPDVLYTAAGSTDEIVWLENRLGETGADADGFGPPQTISTEMIGPVSVFAADFDGDSDPDVLAPATPFDGEHKIAWFENQTGESGADSDGFGSEQTITTSVEAPRSLHAADIDGDGDPDVLSLSDPSVGSDRLIWFENQIGDSDADSDGFGSEQVITTNVSAPQSVFAVDLNGDAAPDILSATGPLGEENRVAWYENQLGEEGADSTGFGSRQTITTSVEDPQTLFAAGLDGDGDADVLSGSFGGKAAWYENQVGDEGTDSDGFASQQVIKEGSGSVESVYAAGLDGDADADVLAAFASGSPSGPDRVSWFENTGSTLPVEVVSFEATPVGDGAVRLMWTTAREQNNAGFHIQRRVGGKTGASWTKIGFVEGGGTTVTSQSYRFTDRAVPFTAATVRYRLQQVDADGTTHLRGPVTVDFGTPRKVALRAPFPNPCGIGPPCSTRFPTRWR